MTDTIAFRLGERIAVGGTAEVYRAEAIDGDRARPVVIKRVLPQFARDPRFVTIFREEALVVASLDHPNIVKLVDFGRIEGTYYLALEHVDGDDLANLLRTSEDAGKPGIDPAHAAWVAQVIADALAYLHSRKSAAGLPLQIVHRDISPHNILVARDGELKLADFGIARSAIRSERTTDGTIKGKLAYMAPEQALPKAAVDARTDIYALGIALFRMVFGYSPLSADDDAIALNNVQRASFSIPETPTELSPLRAIIARAVRRDPAERYADAAELRDELATFRAAYGEPSEPFSSWVERMLARRGEPPKLGGLARQLLGSADDARGTAVGGPRAQTISEAVSLMGESSAGHAAPASRAPAVASPDQPAVDLPANDLPANDLPADGLPANDRPATAEQLPSAATPTRGIALSFLAYLLVLGLTALAAGFFAARLFHADRTTAPAEVILGTDPAAEGQR